MKKHYTLLIILFLSINAIFAQTDDTEYYPPIAQKSPTYHILHGDTITDNYGWLKNKKNTDVINYLYAENAYANNIMKNTNLLQKKIYDELRGFSKEDYQSLSTERKGYFYYYRLEKDHDFPLYCRKKGSMDAKEEIYFDMNLIVKEYFGANVQALSISRNQNLIGYILGLGGKESGTLYFKNLTTGKTLKDEVLNASSVLFETDSTVFYTAFDKKTKTSQKIYRHKLNDNQKNDRLIFEEKRRNFSPSISETSSHNYLIINTGSFNSSENYYRKTQDNNADFQLFQPAIPNVKYFINQENNDDFFAITTNYNAPNFTLMKAPIAPTPPQNWVTLIPENKKAPLLNFYIFKNYFVINEIDSGIQKIKIQNRQTNESYFLDFEEPIYTASLNYRYKNSDNKFRFSYTSPISPTKIFDYNLDTKQRKILKETKVKDFKKEEYTTERIWATAPDSTKIPIDLFYKKSLKRDGTNPVYLYAYASYGMNQYPIFNTGVLPYTDRNFIYALAHPRGESLMGTQWHEQGRLMHKKNTYTDFIACAQYLIDQNYTKKGKIAIHGGSAGGMLMGAVTVMRPDLFKAVIADVPFVDVLIGMQDTLAAGIVQHFEEFGNPFKKNEYFYLKSWCPYQNTKAEAHLPNILVTAGYNDPRVPYYAPAKWVAKIRSLKTDSSMLLLKTNMGGGHFGSSGSNNQRQETAFKIAFILKSLGIEQNYIQLSGKVTDRENAPLPFANVYISGTTNGTMTNYNGEFVLTVENIQGKEIVFQSVGYKKKTIKMNMKSHLNELNITLEDENLRIQEVIVTADGKDPAYGIIKNAIEKRKFHYNQVKTYSADIYMKGSTRLNEIPKKFPSFFPKDQMPDSTDLALLDITESTTRYHFKKPNTSKEEMHASIQSSGNNAGYSFNRADLIDFDFYKNQVEVMSDQRGFYSPISNNAMFFYRYKLINSFLDNGKTIYKIKVIPRRKIDPVFNVYIYITDSTFQIHSLDLMLPKSTMLNLTDSLRIKQIFVPVSDDISMPLSVQIYNYFKLFGFGVTSDFYGNFYNYNLNEKFPKKYFRNEVFRIEKGANKKDTLYWHENRRAVLTDEEKNVYLKADSIYKRTQTKEYRDSVYAKLNKPKWRNLIMGYKYYLPKNNGNLGIKGLARVIDFNSVEGFTANLNPTYKLHSTKKMGAIPVGISEKFELSPTLKYSFTNNNLYAKVNALLSTDYTHQSKFLFAAGKDVFQYNNNQVNKYYNIAYSLFAKQNYLKLYEKTFAHLTYYTEIINGLYFDAGAEYSKNHALKNNTEFAFFNKENNYSANNTQDNFTTQPEFNDYNSLTFEANIKIIFKQKYSVYPDYKTVISSSLPILYAKYKKGINALGGATNYDYAEIAITDNIKLNNFGTTSYAVKIGTFFTKKQLGIVDFKHFYGNQIELQTFKNKFGFEALNYYSNSTNSAFAEAHITHHFNGWIINKLPLLRRTKTQAVVGGAFLYTQNQKDYSELYFGVENIFKVLRVDVAGQYSSQFGFQPQFRIGFALTNLIHIDIN